MTVTPLSQRVITSRRHRRARAMTSLGRTLHELVVPGEGELSVVARLVVEAAQVGGVRVAVVQTDQVTQPVQEAHVARRAELVAQDSRLVLCLQRACAYA